EIKFPLPETEPEHKGDYYLHIFYGEHHSGVTLPALHNRYVPPNPIQGEKEVPYSGSYLLHRTDDLFEAKRVNKLLFSGTSFFERKAPVTNWPESPLAISIRKKEIFAFSYLPNISEYKVKRKKALPEKKEGEEKVIYSLYEPHHGGFRRSEVPSASIFHKVPTTYKRISFVPEGSQTSGKPVNVKTLVGEIFIHYVLPFPYYHPAWLVLQQLGSILFKLEPEGKVNNLSDMILSCKNEDGKYGLFGGEGASWKISLDLYDALNLYFSFPIVKPDQKLLELYKQLEVNLKKKLSFLFEPKYNLRDVYKILAYKEGNMLIREGCPYQLPTLCFHLLTKISDKDELSLYRKTKKYQKPITEAASRSIFKKLGVVEEKFETVYEPILEKLEKPVQTLSEFSHFYLLPDFYPAIERLTAFLSFLKNFGNKKLQGQIIEENLEPSLPVQGKYPENSFFISKKLFNKGERGQIQWEKNLRGSYRILFPSFIELFEDSEYIRKGSGIYIKPALFSRPTISFRCKEKGEGAIFILVENDKSEDGFYLWELDTISVV
ncbi:MAG: hypothetical protein KDK45_04530, partial [Leptospiraceae bacterium]|nr:hypothetical protein [Leptospiraceae bacterium]